MSENALWRRRRCKSCNAVVIWAKAAQGEPMPVDPEPHPRGNVELFAPPGIREPIATVVRSDEGGERLFEVEERVRYRPHWATCPDSEEWRTRIKRSRGSEHG